MFRIFKRRKDKPALTYGVIQYISEAVERRRRMIAGYLNSRTKGYSKRKWLLLLIAFCGSMGGIATAILLRGMKYPQNKAQVQEISVPAFMMKSKAARDSLVFMEEIYRHRRDHIFGQQNDHKNK